MKSANIFLFKNDTTFSLSIIFLLINTIKSEKVEQQYKKYDYFFIKSLSPTDKPPT